MNIQEENNTTETAQEILNLCNEEYLNFEELTDLNLSEICRGFKNE